MYIALFRGINVGGKNKIPMKALIQIIESKGYSSVRTYIQSGNVLFQGPSSEAVIFPNVIGKAIKDKYGFCPHILILSMEELGKAVSANPFPEAQNNSKSLHLYFLDSIPKDPDFEGLIRIKAASESFELIQNVFYLYAPEGIGRSKLAAKVERLLGVVATARNWNTVAQLLEMKDG